MVKGARVARANGSCSRLISVRHWYIRLAVPEKLNTVYGSETLGESSKNKQWAGIKSQLLVERRESNGGIPPGKNTRALIQQSRGSARPGIAGPRAHAPLSGESGCHSNPQTEPDNGETKQTFCK
ncbi:hypothetical protein GWI33_011401 [Rhynchophorus ferrugineus]|uniref:Uncharacterized protein n=1 Tax=Rhynchophorus ferrugineus TaxID=354439 RepID=A0A834IQC1_RHYFE|nr:hypothetical protein GWI33_011401 [Rhynchophorus ferrugineus]